MAGGEEINQTTLTLRFKNGRQTILLFADPNTPLPTIIIDLLSVLSERFTDGLTPPPSASTLENLPIPTDVLEVSLGVPRDTNDPKKGWSEIDTGIAATPRGLGLKDGDMVAFMLMGGEEGKANFWVEFSDEEALYPEDE